MGLFLSMSGIVGASKDEVLAAINLYALENSEKFSLVNGVVGESGIGVVCSCGANVTILYPDDFYDWDAVSGFISKKISRPVFSFHIHDEDLWMYVLFNKGKEVDWFNPVPKYWNDNLSKEEKLQWSGSASTISKLIPNIAVDKIEKYLIDWNLNSDLSGKAYIDDEFEYHDCWQICDFMKHIGLRYPLGKDGSVLGETFFLGKTNEISEKKESSTVLSKETVSNKPWWKIG